MMPAEGVLSFGPFQLDPARRRLTRDGEPIALPDRHVDILLLLASNAGRIVPKDALIEAGWKDVAVSDNSIEQAISGLRKTLGSQQDGTPYIETLARRGYRLAVPVERGQPRQSDAALDALLAPYRAFVSWGEERLRAAHRVLTLCPGLALAYWFAATVFVARQAFDAALVELRAGCASQDAQRRETGRFNAVGLHLLHGLVLAAQGS